VENGGDFLWFARGDIHCEKEGGKEMVGPIGDRCAHVNRDHGYAWKSYFAVNHRLSSFLSLLLELIGQCHIDHHTYKI
jgi:hypothetical protein